MLSLDSINQSTYEILRYENSDNLKRIVTNDKSQGNLAAHLRYDGLFSYHFTVYLVKKKLILMNTSLNYSLDCFMHLVCLAVSCLKI